VPTLATAKHGSSSGFQQMEVPIHSVRNAMFELIECLPSSKTSSFVFVSTKAETLELFMLVLYSNCGVGSVSLQQSAPPTPRGWDAILSL
jgi:hypothetical protein